MKISINCLALVIYFCLFQSIALIGARPIESSITDSYEIEINKSKGREKVHAVANFGSQFALSHPQKTLSYIKQIDTSSQNIGNVTDRAMIVFTKGMASMRTGSLEVGKALIDSANFIFNTIPDTINMGRVHLGLGYYYYLNSKYDSARSEYQQAMELLINYPYFYFIAKERYASSYLAKGEILKAIELFDGLLTSCSDPDIYCRDLMLNKAIALIGIGKYEEALRLIFKVSDEFRKENHDYGLAVRNHLVGFVLYELGLFDEAIEYYEPAHLHFSKTQEFELQSKINQHLGLLYLRRDKLKLAEFYLNNSLKIYQKHGLENYGTTLIGLGRLYLKRKQYPEAIAAFDQAKFSFANRNDDGIGSVYKYLAITYFRLGDLEIAKEFGLNSLSINQHLGLKIEEAETYGILSEIYEKLGQYESALEAKNNLSIIGQELKGPEKLLEISRILVLEKLKENTYNGLLSSRENTVINLFSYWIILPILLFFIGGFLLYWTKFRSDSLKKKTVKTSNAKRPYLIPEMADEIIQRLRIKIENDSLYLNQNLTLRALAQSIDTTDKKLSTVLNQYLNTNFYDFINSYRIELFIKRIEEKASKEFSIVGIAQACGFKSKSSFYRALKKVREYLHPNTSNRFKSIPNLPLGHELITRNRFL